VEAGAGLADLDEPLCYGCGGWALIFLGGPRLRGAPLTTPVEIECSLDSRYSTRREDALSIFGLVIAVMNRGHDLGDDVYLIGKLAFQ
jgi:hypothetical protein